MDEEEKMKKIRTHEEYMKKYERDYNAVQKYFNEYRNAVENDDHDKMKSLYEKATDNLSPKIIKLWEDFYTRHIGGELMRDHEGYVAEKDVILSYIDETLKINEADYKLTCVYTQLVKPMIKTDNEAGREILTRAVSDELDKNQKQWEIEGNAEDQHEDEQNEEGDSQKAEKGEQNDEGEYQKAQKGTQEEKGAQEEGKEGPGK